MTRRIATAALALAAYCSTAAALDHPTPIEQIYHSCLGRSPESPAVVDYWQRHPDPSTAVCTSAEAVDRNEARGLAHFSSSTWLPAVMLDVRRCESGGDYTAENSRSSAAGGWQMIQSTSDEAARRMGRPDLIGTPASTWTVEDQDRAAAHVLQFQGLAAWNASRGCWA